VIILCEFADGKKVSLETIKQGFRMLVGPMIAGSYETTENPESFAEVYRDPYTSAHFLKFVNGMDRNMRFNVENT
jgi:hypothetical protein